MTFKLRMMKGIKTIILTSIVGASILTSCDNNKSQNVASQFEEEEIEALPFGASDTINGEVVSIKCATVNFDFELLQRRIENVKSPDMLMSMKAEFQRTLDSLTNNSNALSADEKAIIDEQRSNILAAYKKTCREYEIPADGVISNLQSCISRLNNANSREDVEKFIDSRRSMLSNLNIIHLCVESNSSKIGEVKRLASQLREELNRKTRHYNINL